MGELLLELLSEEIPARMQQRAIDDLVRLLRDKLAAAEIPAAGIRGYVAPRRLVAIADGLPPRQPDRTEERRGPRVEAPQQAIDGFLRAAGLKSIDECEIRDTGRGRFYFAVVRRPGRDTAAVLPELVQAAIAGLPWPKSMRYPASNLRWVRPLTSVVSLLDGEVLPLALDRVPVGRLTRGHRWLSNGPIEVAGVADYARKLAEAHVVLDRDERRRIIEQGLAEAAAAAQVTLAPDPDLLDEVAGLAEYPVVLTGAIDADFMALPPEVLRASMRTHQRYFSCLNPDGTPAPRFLFVADNVAPDGGRTIVAGNERVLRARLADARFFWDQDRKVRLEDRVEALKGRVYHEKLGSMYDKVERMAAIAEDLALRLNADVSRVCRAARLAKADLSTGMVGEFPELQGVMGRYYARYDGEDPRVADAIAAHYKPLGPNDACPAAMESVVVALADKLDTIASFFRIDARPTGSGDPFALRRAVLGIIRIILENRLRLPLSSVLLVAVDPKQPFTYSDPTPLIRSLTDFIADRLWVHLRERGVRRDLIAAVFAIKEDDLVRLLARVAALQAFLETDDGSNLLIAYRRASNIVSIEERRDNKSYAWEPQPLHDALEGERMLSDALGEIAEKATEFVSAEKFEKAMAQLARLRQPVDVFFDKVTVNCDDATVRERRLRLLSRIRGTMNLVADFSKIEG